MKLSHLNKTLSWTGEIIDIFNFVISACDEDEIDFAAEMCKPIKEQLCEKKYFSRGSLPNACEQIMKMSELQLVNSGKACQRPKQECSHLCEITTSHADLPFCTDEEGEIDDLD